jgi:hypothetical protein
MSTEEWILQITEWQKYEQQQGMAEQKELSTTLHKNIA